jgi:hypothetical protein
MGAPLTADENAALIQRLGWTDPPAQAPPPAPAPVAPYQAAPAPLDQALADANGGAARPQTPIVTPSRPGAPPNAHVPGDYSRTALAPEQTQAFTGPPPGAPAPQSQGYAFPESSGGGGAVSGGSSRTVQKGIKPSDETKAMLDASTVTALDANAQEQAGQRGLTAAKAEGSREQAKLYGEQANAERVLASESDEQLGRKRAHLDQMIADVQGDKVDPERFWHTRSTGQRIGIALAMIAGGFAGGWNGTGKNGAADMLDRAVQNDIHAQEENLANKRAGVQQQSQLYEMARGEFHDRAERMRAMHVTALAQVGKQIDARIAEASDPIEAARLKEARAGIFAKAGESRLRLDEMGADRVSTTTHSSFSGGGGVSGPSRKEFDALTEKLVLEKNLSSDEAHVLAAKMLQLPGAPQGNGSAPSGHKGNPTDAEKAQGILNSDLKVIDRAKANIDKITAGTTAGSAWAKAPGWVPGATEAKINASERDKWNSQVKIIIGGAYKQGTDANEPKNLALIEEFAKPFEIKPGDNAETAAAKIDNLRQFAIDNASAKGATPQDGPSASNFSYLKPSGGAR